MRKILRKLAVPAVLALVLAFAPRLRAGAPAEAMDAAGIRLALKKLNTVGSVLYVAAHPDDENTAFLAWGAKGQLVETAYLSMTRGDGGQNLIGPESAELLGLLRTEELLAARRIDGARQFFTRAIDFGYSKNPEETLAIWDREKVLSDVVRVFRTFRPDVVVNRFPTTGEGGHGHHTASAILSVEAFDAAGDPNRFPEQIAEGLRPWRPRRLFFNAFRFRPDQPRTAPPGSIPVDLGGYNALLGRSYTEIAAQARTMHKSQGFGSAERRGTWLNDFVLLKGDRPKSGLFDGIDLTWKRVPGGETAAPLLAEAERTFRDDDPAASLPILIKAWGAVRTLPRSPETDEKRAELLDVIRSCAGIWIEAVAAEPAVTPGGAVKVATMILNRSTFPMRLEEVDVTDASPAPGGELKPNEPLRAEVTMSLPADQPLSNPYWLTKPHGKGLYAVADPSLIGRAEAPPPLVARFRVAAGGATLTFTTPVVTRRTDPVRGEVYAPFDVVPPVTATFDESVYAFAGAAPKKVAVTLRSFSPASGTLRLDTDGGWRIAPAEIPFSFETRDEERSVTVTITPPPEPAAATLRATAIVGGRGWSRSLVRVDYPHIPRQTMLPPAESKLLRLDITTIPREIGYVMGPGDTVPDALRQIGYRVTLLSDDDIESGDLSRFGTIVTGIRAFNTRPGLKALHAKLLRYVEWGGALVVQYDTTAGLVTPEIGPWPFRISHDRVSVEEAPVAFADPASPLLRVPNRIGPGDFDGWVQERGLYFAGSWDPRYATPLSLSDPGETPTLGSLLYARYGKGAFVYTGLAFFRQLPAGVPGAYRLFVNLIEGGRGAK
ncbi:MAG: PIG-L family deacetylase [Acidithiobacillales bacterium]